ncbi:solute carrier family 35 member F1-like [Gigantopelta aegis]|uniref:solute carrier family 35 member F1-like n=1 Tax=Gigantopelta aegis TaxID=1735272 RepID=UPI001B88B024|nr:solute carrier family 35 member F1-like [Gigantopelta aegis]XP_041355024.1 solute carrier family 35 member F1-like [Gigantopelta aegis]
MITMNKSDIQSDAAADDDNDIIKYNDEVSQHGLMKKCFHNICNREFLKALLLGQFLSLLLCGTGIFTGLLAQEGVHTPAAQSFVNYVLLCLVFTVILACRYKERTFGFLLKNYWWKYLLLSLVDVEANYLAIKAYSYTTVTSVQLLDCISLPTVMLLSAVFLRVRYHATHFTGAFICLLGSGGLIAADVLSGRNSDSQGSRQWLGDIFCVLAAILYGVSNIGQEFVVKQYDRSEFLGMVGLFGSFISGIQFAVLERHEVETIDFTSYKIILPWLGFLACQFLLYTCMAIIIKYTSATMANISILSADFYTVILGIFIFKYQFHILYFVAFFVIICGVTLYSIKPTQTRTINS